MRVLELIIIIRVVLPSNLNKVCYVTLVTQHKRLFCHFGNPTQQFVLNSPERNCRASYRSIPTEPVIDPFLLGQITVQRSTGAAIDPDLQSQLSVQIYKTSYDPDLHGEL